MSALVVLLFDSTITPREANSWILKSNLRKSLKLADDLKTVSGYSSHGLSRGICGFSNGVGRVATLYSKYLEFESRDWRRLFAHSYSHPSE